MKTNKLLWLMGVALLLSTCTPKTTEQARTEQPVEQPAKPAAVAENLSPCPKFSDAPVPDEAETNYVLYRDFLRAGDWNKAFDFWQKVYEVAPAADGQRNTVYADGIRFYEFFMTQTQDSLQKEAFIDQVFAIYDQIQECYPEGGYIVGRKAFDLYYKYPQRANRDEVYAMFKESIDTDGLKTNDFVVNPFSALLTEMYFDGKISMEEAQTYQQKIRDIIAHGLKECEGVGCERWKIIEEYAPVRLEAFETVRGFYDCEYYKRKYYPEFEAAQSDCDVVRTVYSRLSWGNCPDTDEEFRRLIRVGNENCAPEPGPSEVAYNCLREADYNCAIEGFEKAAAETDDIDKKATYLLLVSKIYNAHLKNFPKARQYALQAAEVKPNWGEPYILIGRLYASSGPLCGPGRGWDSQVVVWPAIDMWNKAKSVDPSAAAEANMWINQYSQYMPSIEDIFQRNLKEGDNFYVGCWIQTSTRIRAARKG